MIATAYLIAAILQQAAAAPAPKESGEIVVVGERLKNWRGRFAVRGGKSTCKTIVSTGDAEIDAIGCQAMATCLPPMQARIIASDAKGIQRDARKDLKAALGLELAQCCQNRRDALVVELVDRRFEARQERNNAKN
ncbi:hypothetical protein [Sphingomonas oligophenolica]|uniref:Uncharacterized protein n=1 Tax=Sphingomonas oligophenolica TaxID=301154 RepID=A0A502CNY8_9SPHN|nr:hypothetical protein [Sphingomonas oligophenolica]TPG14462.1 hypothetical protein EAH84_03940 [Sphingomonas oligophenolica]